MYKNARYGSATGRTMLQLHGCSTVLISMFCLYERDAGDADVLIERFIMLMCRIVAIPLVARTDLLAEA